MQTSQIRNSQLKENSIVLNALKLNTEGFVQMVGDKINMDIKYERT